MGCAGRAACRDNAAAFFKTPLAKEVVGLDRKPGTAPGRFDGGLNKGQFRRDGVYAEEESLEGGFGEQGVGGDSVLCAQVPEPGCFGGLKGSGFMKGIVEGEEAAALHADSIVFCTDEGMKEFEETFFAFFYIFDG